MRRALVAVALLCSVAGSGVAMAAGGGATVVDPNCEFDARLAPDRKAIKFALRCENVEPHRIAFHPTTGVRSVTHYPAQKPFIPGDTFYCERLYSGRGVSCFGHMEDGATTRGRLVPQTRICRTAIPWSLQGGVDCDGDEICVTVALNDRGRVGRPRGC